MEPRKSLRYDASSWTCADACVHAGWNEGCLALAVFSPLGTIKGLTPDQMGDESMDCQVEYTDLSLLRVDPPRKHLSPEQQAGCSDCCGWGVAVTGEGNRLRRTPQVHAVGSQHPNGQRRLPNGVIARSGRNHRFVRSVILTPREWSRVPAPCGWLHSCAASRGQYSLPKPHRS